MGFVIQMAPGKAEGGSRTGRIRVARQRSRGPSGREDRGRDARDTAKPLPGGQGFLRAPNMFLVAPM